MSALHSIRLSLLCLRLGLFSPCGTGKDILFVNGIVFAECSTYGCEQFGIFIIGIDVAAEFRHGVLHFQYCRDFAGFGIYHSYAIRFLDSEIDVMEDTAALPPVPKAIRKQPYRGISPDRL